MLFLLLRSTLRGNQESVTHLKKTLLKSKVVWTLAALFIVFLLASIFSVDPYFSFWGSPYRGGGFVTFAFYFIFAIMAFVLLKKEDWGKAWLFSIFIGVLVSFIALFQFHGIFSNILVSVESRPGSTTGNPIFLGIYLLLLFFPTLIFAIKEPFNSLRDKIKKIFYIFSLLLFLYIIFITGSRAAYLGIIAGILYFLFFYPKRLRVLKFFIALFLFLVIFSIFYINTQSRFPQILQQNRIFGILEARLSIKQAFNNERFRAWQTVTKEIKDKPILGWGPENLAVGFDKNYDPNVTWSPWWDKAHNVLLDIGAQAGILGITTYLLLFVVLIWRLQKTKHKTENESKKIIITGIQATLVGYLIANFFSFDSFPTYLLFFFIIGYSLFLIESESASQNDNPATKARASGFIIGVALLLLIVFLWQYNLIPFQINTQINIANNWVSQKKCERSFALMDKMLQKHSFTDSYARMKYVDNLKICAGYYPENDLSYAKRGVQLLSEAVKIQPLYLRYWIYLGSFTTDVANSEQDPQTKISLLVKAESYFEKAETLSPNHQEIALERAKKDMVAGDYQQMKQDAQKCIEIIPDYSGCYWMKALSETYLKEYDKAEEDISLAKKYGFDTNTTAAIYQLIDIYNKSEQYDKLVVVYEKLISLHPTVPEYHSSLAFVYAKVGEYRKAREQAIIFYELVPGSKDEVNAFLKTLPY